MEEKRKGKKKSKKTFKSIGIEMGDETKVNIEERERQKKRKECSANCGGTRINGVGGGYYDCTHSRSSGRAQRTVQL